ncbi:MAG: protein translocase subunit SecD [Verrucomicrobiota bacterium]
MDYSVLVLSFTLLIFFIWYLATTVEFRRKWVALGVIFSMLSICALSLIPPGSEKSEPEAEALETLEGQDQDQDQAKATEEKATEVVQKEGLVEPWPVNITPGIDLSGGTQFIIELRPGGQDPEKASSEESEKKKEISSKAVEQAVEVLRKRIDSFGVAEPIIQPLGKNRIIVQVPGITEEQKIQYRRALQRVAKLEFRLVHPNNEVLLAQIATGQEQVPFDHVLMPFLDRGADGKRIKGREILVSRRPEMGGKHVTSAYPSVGQLGAPEVIIKFDGKGADQFGKLTQANTGRRMAIVLDGEVYSAPNINEPIYGGSCSISGGSMTPLEAEELSSVLENPLETPVEIVDERGVDPTLGKTSIKDGFNAAVLGLALVVIFMIAYYTTAGLFSVIALSLNLVILLGLLAQFGFTLTLPGVAGIILTIGMAVDANVLIFERMREEIKLKKPIRNAVEAGFAKAFSSIVDANMTTLIAAVFMFWQGSGAVRGFAVVLCLGILASLFSSLIVTRTCFDWMLYLRKVDHLRMVKFLSETRIDFISKRFAAAGFSLVLIIFSIFSFASKGKDALGVDFAGGALATYSFEKKISDDQLQSAKGALPATIQYQSARGEGGEILSIRASEDDIEPIEGKIMEAFPEAQFKRLQLDKVKASIGGEFLKKAAVALVLGLIGIFFYVVWRFEMSFAIGAIVALLHDVIITLGIFTAIGHQFSLTTVGAILTVAGYSINDTIVIFDRIREGLRTNPRLELKDVINTSLNATLSRTVITSATTMIVLGTLYFQGGHVINDFALLLLMGLIAGTYSSLFIASPIVFLFGAKAKNEVAVDPEFTGTTT